VPRLAFSQRHHTDNLHIEREFPPELRSYDPILPPYSKSRASSFRLLFLKVDLASTLKGSWLPSHVKAEERFLDFTFRAIRYRLECTLEGKRGIRPNIDVYF
jgi:hypothetical protein